MKKMTPEEAIDKFAEMVTKVAPINEGWFCVLTHPGGNKLDAYCYTDQEFKPIIVGIVVAIVVNILFSLLCSICCRK